METSPESSQFNPEDNQSVKNFRNSILGFEDLGKQRADELLRAYLPSEIFDHRQEINVIDWLAHQPTDNKLDGATDSEIKKLLQWNANHTKNAAEGLEVSESIEATYLKINKSITQGKIDQSWNSAPSIDGILVGNLLDTEFLGINNQKVGAQFDHEDRKIIIYPYGFTPEEINGLLQHEIVHSFGGFDSRWLDEGATERFNAIVSGENPTGYRNEVYLLERFTLKYLMEAAPKPFNDYHVSAFFGGSRDYEQNQELFRQFVQESYQGIDVIGGLDKIYDEIEDESSATFSAFRAAGVITSLMEVDGNSAKKAYLDSLEQEDQHDEFLIEQLTKLFKL